MTTRAVAILALVGGCDVIGGGGGGDDEPPGDAGPTGLSVRWQSSPEVIPTEDSRVSRAVFQLSNLRVVGDAGPLSLGMRVLDWASEREPEDITIADAPSGLYSRCLFDLVAPSGGYAYEIEGLVERNDTKVPFVIRDRSAAAIAMDFSEVLAPGGEGSVEIKVRIDHLVDAVEFAQVPLQNGMLIVEDGSAQLARVRLEMQSAFEPED